MAVRDAGASADKHAEAVVIKERNNAKESRLLLKELFSRMPSRSVEEVLEHGFQKGKGRVGRSLNPGKKQRAELAVQASPRHKFTDHESYLAEQKKAGKRSFDLESKAGEELMTPRWACYYYYEHFSTPLAKNYRSRYRNAERVTTSTKGHVYEAKDGRPCS